ncbi:hypothetical protein LUZ60_014023 [Juncus effusus]|nr:hypothetical protein LUZ60_014023 [Juncus effusus]
MDFDGSYMSKTKVIFILGATGTGKSKLAISLATRFSCEIINSDKIQVYDALPVITNRVSEAELSIVPHHLLGFLPPHVDFSPTDFTRAALESIRTIVSRNNLPIVVGGSLSFVDALLKDPKFRESHEPCFIWLDVDSVVLNRFLSIRVDEMVEQGLLEEARSVFDTKNCDYNAGVRRAIGVPELNEYFRAELAGNGNEGLERLYKMALDDVKGKTCNLARKQVEKIQHLSTKGGYHVSRIDPSDFFMKKLDGSLSVEDEEEVWEQIVSLPSQKIVNAFLGCKNADDYINTDTNADKTVDATKGK